MYFKFIEWYMPLNTKNLNHPSQSQSKSSLASTGKQQHVNMDDTESEGEDGDGEGYDAERPWFAEWNHYEKMHKAVPEHMGIVQWWGVRHIITLLLHSTYTDLH